MAEIGHVFFSPGCSARDTQGLVMANLAADRLRLDRLSRNALASTFFPWASPIPREARKSPRGHPPLRRAGLWRASIEPFARPSWSRRCPCPNWLISKSILVAGESDKGLVQPHHGPRVASAIGEQRLA